MKRNVYEIAGEATGEMEGEKLEGGVSTGCCFMSINLMSNISFVSGVPGGDNLDVNKK